MACEFVVAVKVKVMLTATHCLLYFTYLPCTIPAVSSGDKKQLCRNRQLLTPTQLTTFVILKVMILTLTTILMTAMLTLQKTTL